MTTPQERLAETLDDVEVPEADAIDQPREPIEGATLNEALTDTIEADQGDIAEQDVVVLGEEAHRPR